MKTKMMHMKSSSPCRLTRTLRCACLLLPPPFLRFCLPSSTSNGLPRFKDKTIITSLSFPSFPSVPYSVSCSASHHYFLLFFCIIMVFPIISSTAFALSASLRFVSLNASALAHEMKISATENMVESMQPHALVIGETKNSHQVVRRLSLRGYQPYDNPGRSTRRKSTKWE